MNPLASAASRVANSKLYWRWLANYRRSFSIDEDPEPGYVWLLRLSHSMEAAPFFVRAG